MLSGCAASAFRGAGATSFGSRRGVGSRHQARGLDPPSHPCTHALGLDAGFLGGAHPGLDVQPRAP